jgi:hypothetical protein
MSYDGWIGSFCLTKSTVEIWSSPKTRLHVDQRPDIVTVSNEWLRFFQSETRSYHTPRRCGALTTDRRLRVNLALALIEGLDLTSESPHRSSSSSGPQITSNGTLRWTVRIYYLARSTVEILIMSLR